MRNGIIIALGFAVGIACSLADELEGKACNTNADCTSGQTCVRTDANDVGLCSSDGLCFAGQQKGCICDDSRQCAGSLRNVDDLDDQDGGNPACYCCPDCVEEGEEPVIDEFVVTQAGKIADCSCAVPDGTTGG